MHLALAEVLPESLRAALLLSDENAMPLSGSARRSSCAAAPCGSLQEPASQRVLRFARDLGPLASEPQAAAGFRGDAAPVRESELGSSKLPACSAACAKGLTVLWVTVWPGLLRFAALPARAAARGWAWAERGLLLLALTRQRKLRKVVMTIYLGCHISQQARRLQWAALNRCHIGILGAACRCRAALAAVCLRQCAECC